MTFIAINNFSEKRRTAAFNPSHHHPRQMPHRRHHDPDVERKLISIALFEELSFKEHAGPFAERYDRTAHTFFPEGIAQANTNVVSTQTSICQGLAIRYRN
jgi:hypothetical protein